MIKALSKDLRHRIRSGVAVSSYAQCVDELVHNALDAGATCIAVRVEISQGKIQVIDNGSGISSEQLKHAAERYHTSKCDSLEDLEKNLNHYGYRGEALASLAHMAFMLEIETRTKTNPATNRKLFREGEEVSVQVSSSSRPSAGTTVTVYDLFHTMPVRKVAHNESLEFERIRQRLEAIALIHPGVSFSLRNDETCVKVLQTHKSNSVTGAFSHLFGHSKALLLCEVSFQEGCFQVNGFIGKGSHHNKSLQFVFINGRLVLKTRIHKYVNQLLTKTTFMKKKPIKSGDKTGSRYSPEGISPRRYAEKHGIFVLNIICPLSAYDITFDPAKTLVEFKDTDSILKCVGNAVDKFVDANGFRCTPCTGPSNNCMGTVNPEEESSQNSQADTYYCKVLENYDMSNSLQSKTVYRITKKNLSTVHEKNELQSAEKEDKSENDTFVLGKCLFEAHQADKNDGHQKVSVSEDDHQQTNTTSEPFETEPNEKDDCQNGDKIVCAAISPTPHTSIDLSVSPPKSKSPCNIVVTSSDEDPKTKSIVKKTKRRRARKNCTKIPKCTEQNRKRKLQDNKFRVRNKRSSLTNSILAKYRKIGSHTPVSKCRASSSSETVLNSTGKCAPKYENLHTSMCVEDPLSILKERNSLSDSKPTNTKPVDTFGVSPLAKSKIISSLNRISARIKTGMNINSVAEGLSERNTRTPKQTFKKHSDVSKHKHSKHTPQNDARSEQGIIKQFEEIRRKMLGCHVQEDKSSSQSKSVITDAGACCANDCEVQKCRASKEKHQPNSSLLRTDAKTESSSQNQNEVDQIQRKRSIKLCADIDTESVIRKLPRVNHPSVSNCDAITEMTTDDSWRWHPNCLSQEEPTCHEYGSHGSFIADFQAIPNRICYSDPPKQKPSFMTKSDFRNTAQECATPQSLSVRTRFEQYQSSYVRHHGVDPGFNAHSVGNLRTRSPEIMSKSKMRTSPDFRSAYQNTRFVTPTQNTTEFASSFGSGRNIFIEQELKHTSPDIYPECAVSIGKRNIFIDQELKNKSADSKNEQYLPERYSKANAENKLEEEAFEVSPPSFKEMEQICVSEEENGFKYDSQTRSQLPRNVVCNDYDVELIPLSQVESVEPLCRDRRKSNNRHEILDSSHQSSLHRCTNTDSVSVLPKLNSVEFPESQGFCILKNMATEAICSPKLTSTVVSSRDTAQEIASTDGKTVVRDTVDNISENNSGDEVMMIPETPRSQFAKSGSFENAILAVDKCDGNKENKKQEESMSEPKAAVLALDENENAQKTRSNANRVVVEKGSRTNNDNFPADSTYPCDIKNNPNIAVVRDETFTLPNNWISRKDHETGRTVFINLKCGNSSYTRPVTTTEKPQAYMLKNRNLVELIPGNAGSFLQANLLADSAGEQIVIEQSHDSDESSHAGSRVGQLIDRYREEQAEEKGIKWTIPERKYLDCCDADGYSENDGMNLPSLLQSLNNTAFSIPEQAIVSAEISASNRQAKSIHACLNPQRFTKEMLKGIKVLKQVDRKFIACIMNASVSELNSQQDDLLILIDQHAAHERIRLEQMTSGLYVDDAHQQILSCDLDPPCVLHLPQHYVRFLEAFRKKFAKFAIEFKIEDRETVSFHGVPATLVERELFESKKTCDPAYLPTQLELLVKEQVDIMEKASGGSIALPRTLHKIICSRACKGAIKFGHSMTVDECEELINQLSRCHHPFQCAHGRPSLMPLLNLAQLRVITPGNENSDKPKLWKLRQMIQASNK